MDLDVDFGVLEGVRGRVGVVVGLVEGVPGVVGVVGGYGSDPLLSVAGPGADRGAASVLEGLSQMTSALSVGLGSVIDVLRAADR